MKQSRKPKKSPNQMSAHHGLLGAFGNRFRTAAESLSFDSELSSNVYLSLLLRSLLDTASGGRKSPVVFLTRRAEDECPPWFSRGTFVPRSPYPRRKRNIVKSS